MFTRANIILMKCRCVLHIFVRTDSRVHKICIPVIKLKFVSQNTCSCHLNVVFTGMVCFSFWDKVCESRMDVREIVTGGGVCVKAEWMCVRLSQAVVFV